MIAEGDLVTGTEPTGNPLSFFSMSMIRFVDGQMAGEWDLSQASTESRFRNHFIRRLTYANQTNLHYLHRYRPVGGADHDSLCGDQLTPRHP
jgi:hypothetical protein